MAILIVVVFTGCNSSNNQDLILNFNNDESGLQPLIIELVTDLNQSNHILAERIHAFAQENQNIETRINGFHRMHNQMSPWVLGLEGQGTPPDIIEAPFNLLQNMYLHGKIESLNLNESHLQDVVITAPDGAVIGLKAKIDPLLLYYNRDIFNVLGLEYPSSEWSWDMFDQTIDSLKSMGHKAYIELSPFTLEWLTMNKYGGRIYDSQEMKFRGYLDHEASAEAAEWLAWVGTRDEEYQRISPRQPVGMVEALSTGQAAIGIEHAYGEGGNFKRFLEDNEQIHIAPLPGGHNMQNPARMTGLAILSKSSNKESAMRLLRYLTENSERYIQDIVIYTEQAWAGKVHEARDSESSSVLLQEVRRSVPASLYMSDTYGHGTNSGTEHSYPTLWQIMNGSPVKDVLTEFAEDLDAQFDAFRNDPDAYGQCIKTGKKLCSN